MCLILSSFERGSNEMKIAFERGSDVMKIDNHFVVHYQEEFLNIRQIVELVIFRIFFLHLNGPYGG